MQLEARRGVPQVAQKRPVPGVEQAGQITSGLEDSVMAYKLIAATVTLVR